MVMVPPVTDPEAERIDISEVPLATLVGAVPPLPSIFKLPALILKVPPEEMVILPLWVIVPPLIVNVPPTTKVLLSPPVVPTVKVFAVAVIVPVALIFTVLQAKFASRSTTCVPAITTSLIEVGTTPPTHVVVRDQGPVAADVIVCALTLALTKRTTVKRRA